MAQFFHPCRRQASIPCIVQGISSERPNRRVGARKPSGSCEAGKEVHWILSWQGMIRRNPAHLCWSFNITFPCVPPGFGIGVRNIEKRTKRVKPLQMDMFFRPRLALVLSPPQPGTKLSSDESRPPQVRGGGRWLCQAGRRMGRGSPNKPPEGHRSSCSRLVGGESSGRNQAPMTSFFFFLRLVGSFLICGHEGMP